MKIELPDGCWHVDVFLDRSEPGYDDNVFVRIREECPEQTKQIRGNEITIGITAADARKLAEALVEVAEQYETAARDEVVRKANNAKGTARRQSLPGPFTSKQGKYLAFINHYMGKFGCSPAEADIQRHFLVSAPTVNQMIQRLERLGLIARTPGQPRSIRVLVPREQIPPL